MITSMTGYGKAVGIYKHRQFTIEIKTLNSKQLDLSIKLPGFYNEWETEIRNIITQILERGKVFCNIQTDSSEEEMGSVVNVELAENYFHELKAMEKRLGIPETNDYLSLLIRMPDTLKSPQILPDHEERKTLLETLKQALAQTNLFREKEGDVMGKDIASRVIKIDVLLDKIAPYEQARIIRIRERIMKALQEGLEVKTDQNRFEQEMIYYLEKLDITEEKLRLSNHVNYFLQVMKEPNANGRKLGFITQEIGREINTLGSKANDSDIQQIVVEMKDELEKIKEQLLNVL